MSAGDRHAPRTGAPAALAFLLVRSGRNRLRAQIGRLKNVRYVIGLLFLIAYFTMVVRPARFYRQPAGPAEVQALISDNLLAVLSLGFTLLVVYWWTFGTKLTPLALSRPEARMLLPAPLSRAQLVLYKLARSHLATLFSAVILAIVSRRASNVLPFPLRVLTYFVLFGTFQLHQLGATLTRTGGRPIGERAGARAWAIGGGVAVLILSAVTVSLRLAWADIMLATEPGNVLIGLREALYTYPALLVIAPARAVVAPLASQSLAEWASTFPIAVAIWLIHIPWILANRTPFEEAAVAAGERREAMRAAIRAQRASGRGGIGVIIAARAAAGKKTYVARRTWLPLAPTGRPWVAIVWKNFIPVLRQLRWATVIVLLLAIAAMGAILSWAQYEQSRDLAESLAFARNIIALLGLVIGILWTILGPLYMRNDFRSDLPYLRLLRTYPLGSGALVGAQIASAAALIFVFQFVVLLAPLLLPTGPRIPGFAARLGLFVALLLALGTLDVLSVTVRNAVALFFPGWVRLGNEGGGFEAIGQNLLGTAGSLLLLSLLLVVPLLLTGAVLYWVQAFAALPRAVNGSLVVALVLFVAAIGAELWFLFRWLGTVYDNIDAGEILEPA